MVSVIAMWLQTGTPVPPTGTSSLSVTAVATILIPVVYIVVQLLKKALPQISGVTAIIVNFVISALGYVVALPQDQWFTMTTLLALATTVAGAAGVHGTVSALSGGESKTGSN